MEPTSSRFITTAIVRELKRFGVDRTIPICLLASTVGRRTEEIMDTLDYLRAEDIVSIGDSDDPDDRTVTLLKP
jgi:hypothetical protein